MFNFLKSGYEKIKSALSKTRSALSQRIRGLFGKPWNDETFDQLEQVLFEADLGTKCASSFVDHLRTALRANPTSDIAAILKIFHDQTLSILTTANTTLPKIPEPGEPYVLLIVGVNGSGKNHLDRKTCQTVPKRREKSPPGSRRHLPRRRHRTALHVGRQA